MRRQREERGWAGGEGGEMGSSLTLLTPPPSPGGERRRMDVVSWRCRGSGGAKDGGKQGREEEEAGRGRRRAGRRSLVSAQTLPDPRRCSRMDAVSKRFEAERVPRGPDLI